MELAVARAVASPRGEEGAARVELLDAVVAVVCDVDVPAPVGRYAVGEVELPVARAGGSPGREEGAAGVELLGGGVGGGGVVGAVELAVARAGASPGRDEGAARVELLNTVVAVVRDVDVPAPVGRYAEGEIELPVARAGAPPCGEEGAAEWHRCRGRAGWGGSCASGGGGRTSRGVG